MLTETNYLSVDILKGHFHYYEHFTRGRWYPILDSFLR